MTMSLHQAQEQHNTYPLITDVIMEFRIAFFATILGLVSIGAPSHTSLHTKVNATEFTFHNVSSLE